jgi:hypothetical protein
MSSIKVSALTAKTSPSGSEELLINDAGTSKKITIANLPDTDTVYTLPTSTASVLGGVKVGTNLSIASGVLSSADTTYTAGTNVAISGGNVISSTDTNTTYSVGDGGLTEKDLTTALKTNYDTAYTHSQVTHAPSGAEANAADTAITTADNAWTGSQRGTTVVDNDGSFDMNGGNNFKCTPAGNFTLTFANITDGQSGFILLVNSGGHTVSAHANSKVDANLLATVTAAGTYLVSYFSDGTNAYLTNSAIYT